MISKLLSNPNHSIILQFDDPSTYMPNPQPSAELAYKS